MKLSYTTLAAPDWTLDQFIQAAVENGYHGLDFRGYKREMDLFELPEFTSTAEATRKRIADAGLTISAFSSNAILFRTKPAEREASIKQVREYAKLCVVFGVEYIRIFGGGLEGTPVEQAVEQAAGTLEEMADIAAPARIAVETHDAWVDSGMMARLMDEVEAENVGVLWDLHHPYRLNGEPVEKTFENIGRHTIYTHIKDSRPTPGAQRPFNYTLPGEGDVPNERMIRMLKDAGYDGWLTLEWEKFWRPDIAEPEVAIPAYAEFLKPFV